MQNKLSHLNNLSLMCPNAERSWFEKTGRGCGGWDYQDESLEIRILVPLFISCMIWGKLYSIFVYQILYLQNRISNLLLLSFKVSEESHTHTHKKQKQKQKQFYKTCMHTNIPTHPHGLWGRNRMNQWVTNQLKLKG